MSEPFLGEIRMVGFNFAPRGWALCNGQLQSISQNSALFALLGTTFGGNGTTTFQLPDLQSRTPVHQGTGPGLSTYVMGQSSGTESVTLLSTQMPQHTHLLNASGAGQTTANPSGAVLGGVSGRGGGGTAIYDAATDGTTLAPTSIGVAGGSQPFSILQPTLCVNFIIALAGVFPSRN